MVNFVYFPAKREFLKGTFTSGLTYRWLLLGPSSTAGSDATDEFLSDIATLDEYASSGYARVTATNWQAVDNFASNGAYIDFDDPVFASLDAETSPNEEVSGALLIVDTGVASTSRLIAYYDQNGYPFTPVGTDVTLQINQAGAYGIN